MTPSTVLRKRIGPQAGSSSMYEHLLRVDNGSPTAWRRMRRDREHFRGCLLGGAVGDALGAPVEFMSLGEIRRAFGPEGVRDFQPAYGKIGAITDDTQMTLFTAEGLLRAEVRRRGRGVCHVPSVVHHAYIR